MDYKLEKLDNDLRLLTVPLPNLESATVTVWAGVGSRYETDKIAGLSHFLEHMTFKGSKKRPSAKEIAEAIDSIGAETNAGTSKEWTNFYIKSPRANIDRSFDVLSDMVLNPLLKDEDIEREKGVIVEEIGMCEDTPLMHINDVFENLIFEGSDLGRDIIGTRKSVRNMQRSDFVRYRKRHYVGENMLVTVAGGIDQKEVSDLTKKYFKDVKKKEKRDYKGFEEKQDGPRAHLHPQKKEQAHFIIGFRASKRGSKDRNIEKLITTILGGGMSSRMFTEVREKRGLAYAVKTDKAGYHDAGYIEVYAGVDPERIVEAIEVIIDQCYGLREEKYPITKKELAKAREYIKGHLALKLEDTDQINRFFGERGLLLGEVETPEDVFEAVDKISVDDIMRVANNIFVPEGLNLAVIGPYEDMERFEKAIE